MTRKISILQLVPKKPERKRLTAKERGYDQAWKKLRACFLLEHPLCMCEDCREGEIRLVQATVVDHCRPIENFPHLRLDWNNLRSMTKYCHDRHTWRMDNEPGYREEFFRKLEEGRIICGANAKEYN